MKYTKSILYSVLFVLIYTSKLYTQNDKDDILMIRNASNQALKSYNTEEAFSYLTDDVLTTTGNGVLLCGKKELEIMF